MDFLPLNPNEGFLKIALKKLPLHLNKLETADDKKLMATCRDFEALFIQQLLKEMRKTVPKDGIIPESYEQSIYNSMLDEEWANSMSESKSFGLADMLFEQLRDKSKDPKPLHEGEVINGKKYLKLN
jgi:flagellar protein FlgJ